MSLRTKSVKKFREPLKKFVEILKNWGAPLKQVVEIPKKFL
jgi:hypothetical protein